MQQVAGDLRADQRNARDVVRRVADQRLEVDDLIGPNTPIGKEFRRAVKFLFAEKINRRLVVEELAGVLVARRQNRLAAEFGNGSRDRRQDVVRFESDDAERRNADRFQKLAGEVELQEQIVRRRAAIRLVFRVKLAAERLGAHIVSAK